MFHQARTPHTQGVGGLGVGLAVARSIAELHGGGLLAESPGASKGATFTLWLPRLSDSQAVDFSVPSLTPLPDTVDRRLLRGRRILLVEDSTDTREALERIFRRRACEVVSAASAEEALGLVNRTPPDIIISDLGLPGMSGIEFMTEVRKHPEWQDVVAVALSGLGRDKDFKAGGRRRLQRLPAQAGRHRLARPDAGRRAPEAHGQRVPLGRLFALGSLYF